MQKNGEKNLIIEDFMTEYIESSLKENALFLNEYIDGISIPYDDFLEDHILRSSIFSIFIDNTKSVFLGN